MPQQQKILSIVGARPQFIKAAMLCRAFEKKPSVEHLILHTGQHYDDNMSRQFFKELQIPEPIANLGINGKSHGELTGSMLIGIEKVLLEIKPEKVVVYGDTDSTLAGALAAAKLNMLVAHVEAGLRSFNHRMPEEINRIVTDQLSGLLFAPTRTAVSNLTRENKPKEAIHFSGDIMFDASLAALQGTDEDQTLTRHGLEPQSYALATLHRAENTDSPERLLTWLSAFNEGAALRPILLPIHPRTKKRMEALSKSTADFPNIRFLNPVGYTTMAVLTKHAAVVITDSGGLQKEAYFHKVPGLILRNETEWVELIETGWSRLVDCRVESLLTAMENVSPPTTWQADIFGDGQSARTVVREILNAAH